MPSILELTRLKSKFDTNEQRFGEACGRRWASMFASEAQINALTALANCPLSWFRDDDGKSLITPDRLAEIISEFAHSAFHKRGFWDRIFGSSARHVAIRNTPAFAHGFVAGAVSISSPEWPVAFSGKSVPGSFLAIERCRNKQLQWRMEDGTQVDRTAPSVRTHNCTPNFRIRPRHGPDRSHSTPVPHDQE